MATPQATYDDLLKSYNDEELADLSHLHLPNSSDIDKAKLEYHLQRAANDWLGWFGFKEYTDAGLPNECRQAALSCEIAIARKRLDFNNPRESVVEEFNFCYQMSRDWKSDQLKKKPDDNTPVDPENPTDVMSAFSI